MHTLYEALTGHFIDGRPLADIHNDDNEMLLSIHNHVSRLLNARRGVLEHMPNYGLPDLNQCYQSLPYSEDDLAGSIKKLIETFEPRLSAVQVTPLPRDLKNSVVRFDISGHVINGGRVRFHTHFTSSCEAQVLQPMSD